MIEPAAPLTPELEEAYRAGLALFDAGHYWESHEELEKVWLEAEDPLFFQGLIQLAAAFHHYGRGNAVGVQSLLPQGMAKLAPYAPVYRGVDVGALLARAAGWRETVYGTAEGRTVRAAAGPPQIPRA